jgi:hypothetical protein
VHGTSEGFGNFSFACSVEPFHKMEEVECKQADKQEKVSAANVSYFAAHAPIEPDSLVTERETISVDRVCPGRDSLSLVDELHRPGIPDNDV